MDDPAHDEDLTDLRKSVNKTLFALKKASDTKPNLGAALPTAFYDGFVPLTMGRSPSYHMGSGHKTINPNPTGGKGAKLSQVGVDYDFGLTGMYLEYWIDPNAFSRRDFKDAKLHVGSD